MHKQIFTLIFALISVQVLSQQQVYDPKVYLEWNEYNPLEWSDFKGTNPEAFGDAGTKVRIVAKPYLIKKTVYYNVYALFDMNNSWANDTGDNLLAHEQLHFDIAELYARKIRAEVEVLQNQGVNSLSDYNKMIKKLLKESNELDSQYDLETLHGSLRNRQTEWEVFVKKELTSLSNFQSGHYKPQY